MTEIKETTEITEENVVKSCDNDNKTEETQTLSKRQKKKLLKLQKIQETKLDRRKRDRIKRKQKKIEALESGQEVVKGPSRKFLKLNKVQNNPAEISVAIDLSFDDLMSDKDLTSTAAQLLRTYTSNRRAKRPIPLYFTSVKNDSNLRKKLDRHEGWTYWDVNVKEESYLELFDKDKIIYLTSDSDVVLDKLEKDAVYIIGGLVDHNHHKSLCLDNATKSSIRTARLPLSEHLVLKSRTVLTINQCFDVILGISEGKSWQETLIEALPKRKNITLKNESNETVDQEVNKSEVA
jgi:tRNA (guanine9-N1)-methyltransferase